VWAAISANGLASFQWPEEVRKLSIYADHDESFAGQRAAYTLAERAKAKGLEVEVVMPEQKGQDWLDALNEVKDA
jgi:phage head maturation protease